MKGGRGHTHDIRLCTDGDETVDVLLDGDKDFAGHVSAFLRAWSLILNVNTCCSLLHEQLGQLHDGCETTMTSVRICNDRSEVVNVLQLAAF